MSVQIIIDSACDMEKREADERGLIFLPLRTDIDGELFYDGVTISHEEFYKKLASCKDIPKTSQLTPNDFSEAYGTVFANGDEPLVITLSSKLSGTMQSAVIAAGEAQGKVWIVDSENVTVGERVLVDYAVRLRDSGLSAAEIARELERIKPRVCIIGLVDTLKYLHKGGRLSGTAAVAATILNIKPVLGVAEGKLIMLGRARGYKQGNNYLNETIRKMGGVDFTMPVMLGHSGDDDTLLRSYINASRSVWEREMEELPITTVGSTIGTHTGPNVIAAAFFSKEAHHA